MKGRGFPEPLETPCFFIQKIELTGGVSSCIIVSHPGGLFTGMYDCLNTCNFLVDCESPTVL